jgi:hypothetical protein
MSERGYRLVMGLTLIILLFCEWHRAVLVYIAVMTFEGVTGQYLTILVSRLRYGREYREPGKDGPRSGWIPFDVERALRLIFAAVLFVSFVVMRNALWFVPWFLGFAFTIAGIAGVCPIAIALKKIGFRS